MRRTLTTIALWLLLAIVTGGVSALVYIMIVDNERLYPLNMDHDSDCLYQRAASGPVGIPCDDHGRDTCPVCDPCYCF